MTDPRKLTATRGAPGDERREMEMMEDARRPPTMIPVAANPHQFEDAAAFRQRAFRPSQKKWITITTWVLFIGLPGLWILGLAFSLVRRFFGW